jgi:hypothetical protein
LSVFLILGYYRLEAELWKDEGDAVAHLLFKEGRRALLSFRVRTHHATKDHRGPETGYYIRKSWLPVIRSV